MSSIQVSEQLKSCRMVRYIWSCVAMVEVLRALSRWGYEVSHLTEFGGNRRLSFLIPLNTEDPGISLETPRFPSERQHSKH